MSLDAFEQVASKKAALDKARQEIQKCLQSCESSKTSDRKRGMNDLVQLLKNSYAIEILNNNVDTMEVNWNDLFRSSHRCLVTESEKMFTDERKKHCTASTVSSRENQKSHYGSVVMTLVKKSKKLKCDLLMDACFEIFGNHQLLKAYHVYYISILRNHVLASQKHRMVISYEQWKGLLETLLELLKDTDGWTGRTKKSILESLELLVEHGSQQSYIGLDIKRLLIPFLEREFSALLDASVEDALISLTVRLCEVMAKESRTGVCHLGETLLEEIMKLYDHRCDESKDRKSFLILKFMLLQVKFHHPEGLRQGSNGAYACDWSAWNLHLRAMYRNVYNKLQRHDKAAYYRPISPVLLDLSVALCNQLFDNENANYNITLLVNETFSCSAPKKRKISIGIQSVMDDLASCSKDTSCWPWLLLLSSLLSRHPHLFEDSHLSQLLDQLWKLQCTSKDSFVMSYICKCCESLVDVMDNRNMKDSLWSKIWETTLRTIGLNQNENESHSLIQILIKKMKVPSSGLENLLRMFQSHMIRSSSHSLKTLVCLLSHFPLPESSENCDSFLLLQPWKQPLGAARMALLKWLLPFCSGDTTSCVSPMCPDLLAQISVLLTLRIKIENDTKNCEIPSPVLLKTSFETDYVISAFERGLLFDSGYSSCRVPESVIMDGLPQTAIDARLQQKLFDLLIARLLFLEQEVESLPTDDTVSLRRLSSSVRRKSKAELSVAIIDHIHLIYCIISNMLLYGTIKEVSLKDCDLIEPLKRSMNCLCELVKEALQTSETGSEVGSDVETTKNVLSALQKLYGAPYRTAACTLLRDITPVDIISPVFSLIYSTTTLKEDETSDQTEDLNQTQEEDCVLAHKDNLSEAMDDPQLCYGDHIRALCVNVLTLFSCPVQNEAFCHKQEKALHKLLRNLNDSDIFDISRPSTFKMIARSIHVILSACYLDTSIIRKILDLLRSLCRRWNQDAEASSHILGFLSSVIKHVSKCEKHEQESTICLIIPFMKKKFGPTFSLQLINVFDNIIMIDKYSKWTRWKCGTNVKNLTDDIEVPPEALDVIRDERGLTAMVEELVVFLNSAFHEVRLIAIKIITKLFSQRTSDYQWEQMFFHRVCAVVNALFIMEVERMDTEEKIDESANRTASVLHMLGAITGSSSQCSTQALLCLLRLIKVKNLDLELVTKVLSLLSTTSKHLSVKEFLDRNLPCLLNAWVDWNFSIQDFPFKLMGYLTIPAFYESCTDSVLPLVFHKERQDMCDTICSELKRSQSDLIKAAFPTVIAQYLPFCATDSLCSTSVRRQFDKLVSIVGNETMIRLLSSKIGVILLELLRLLQDPSHYEYLLGIPFVLSKPKWPNISFQNFSSALENLQRSLEENADLLLHVAIHRPSVIQEVLLTLRVDVCAPVMLQQKLLSLHQYCAFSEVLATYLEQGKFSNIAEFLVRDISLTLLFFVDDYQHDPVMRDISSASCRYLKLFYKHVLPLHANVVGHILPNIVGVMVPLTQSKGPLVETSFSVLELIIVNHSKIMAQAIGQLPPFPRAPIFHEMHRIHHRAKYGNKTFDLHEEIVHFLVSVRNNKSFTNWGCMLEGLQFLRKELADKKNELLILYKNLEEMRGFSKDCAESILHQLVSTLIFLGSSSNFQIQQEAARCLGELGPADLTTLVLKPVDDCVKLAESPADPLMLFLESVACLLMEFLLDANVNVVVAACKALYGFLSTTEAEALLESRNRILQREKVAPFIPVKGFRNKVAVTKDKKKTISLLGRDEIWCPDKDMTHELWITNLVSELLLSLSDDDSFFRLLLPVVSVKTTCAERLLPVLLNLLLHHSKDVCEQISSRIDQFFLNHCVFATSLGSSPVSFEKGVTNVYLNKLSVQCMISTVNFIHFHKITSKDETFSFDLNYLHVARAAQFCCAYFSSIMYAELWCSTDDKWAINPSGFSVGSHLDQICETFVDDGRILQSLFREAFKQIGDHDAMYGCGSSMLVNPATRVNYYEHVGMWNQVLLDYDMKLCNSPCTSTTVGLVNAMQNCGLLHLMNTFLGALPAEHKEQLLPLQLDCMWRLGQWEDPVSASNEKSNFDWSRFIALKSFSDGDKMGAIKAVEKGRFAILSSLTSASLESCNNIYSALASFEALQGIEDIVSSSGLEDVVCKWNAQSLLPQSNFLLFESVVAQRAKMLECSGRHVSSFENSNERENFLLQALIDVRFSTAKRAREEGKVEIAELWLNSLSSMSALPKHFLWKLRFEHAQLAWSRGKGAVNTDYNAIACQQLRCLLKELKSSPNDSEGKINLHARALSLYGSWMAESHSETPQSIIENYMKEALSIVNTSKMTHPSRTLLEAHYCLARFADLEYQRIKAYHKSEIFERKQLLMEKLRSDGNQEQDRKTASLHLKSSIIDEEEIRNSLMERDLFIELSLRHYLEALTIGEEDEHLSVFRLVSLWLENSSHSNILKLINSFISRIQTHKFVVLLPQLAAGVGDSKDTLCESINNLFRRCAIEHPHHTLPLILALVHSYKNPEDLSSASKSAKDVRVIAASRLLSELRKNNLVKDVVVEMEKLSVALIDLAYLPVDKNKSYSVPKGEKIRQLQDLEHILLPVLSLPVRCDGKYENIIGIHKFEGSFTVANGITKPKKIICLGTDGVKRPVLVKGKDDLRQDAVMQQVFAIMNTLLKKCKETKRRKLTIRTYKVVPLTHQCGILEWCVGTSPLGEILQKLHSKYYRDDLTFPVCRTKIERARNASNAERLRVYLEVCKNFHPAFRFFFTETYATPAEWFEHRLAYVHSVSTNSMVGYILGLGDRHVANILVDENTAELVHIDFGIAFELGHILPTPETVPFRLTRDIEDGMGVCGIEGVFRRSCEKTMAVLRKNQDTILTILEVLLYDPLYVWTTTPKKAANRQRGSKIVEIRESPEDMLSTQEKNKMAERALSRLKQKLQGIEKGAASSVEGQVNHLIQQARDPSNLSRLFCGWQAYL